MSATLSTVASKLYDSAVKNAYQGNQKLRNTVYTKTTKNANEMKFRAIGKGLATLRGVASSDIVPMNVTHELINCPLADYVAGEYTDIFNNADVNFSEVNELGELIASALGRRSDQMILDALASTTTTAVGATGTALSVDTLLSAKRVLDAAGVPSSDRTLVIDSKGLEDLLKTTQVTSSDFNTVKALVSGDVNTFLGFKIIQIENRDEGGIDNDGTDYTAFAYHKRSVGFALNMDIATKTDWIPQKLSWLSNGTLKAGSTLIDNTGVVPITYGM